MAHEWTEQELEWASVTTSKQINVRQLAALLGTDNISVNGKPLGENVEKEIRANCTQAKLESVISDYSKDDSFGLSQDAIAIDTFIAKDNPTQADVIKVAKAMARRMRGR